MTEDRPCRLVAGPMETAVLKKNVPKERSGPPGEEAGLLQNEPVANDDLAKS